MSLAAKYETPISPVAPAPAPELKFGASAEPAVVARWLDALAIGALALAAAIAFATFRDYGLGWDDYTHSQYGSLLVSLYGSGFADKRAFSFVNLYMYGGGFDLLAALAAKVLPLDLFETRRLIGAAVGLTGLFVIWRVARRLGGPLAGLIGLVLLATCPLYYGQMFINAKDAPFAVAMAIALLGVVLAFEAYPRVTPASVALGGVGVGLAIGSRVMGGFALVEALLPLLLIFAIRSREISLKPAFAECSWFFIALSPGAILAYLVMGLVWPWAVLSPINPFRAVEYFSNFFEKPWRELFEGRLIPIPDMPRSYVPTLIALKVPELMLALGLCGMIGAAVAALRGGSRNRGATVCSTHSRASGNQDLIQTSISAGRRAALLSPELAAIDPVVVTVAARPAMYNGIRHFLFVLPPLAVLGGLAGAWIARRLQGYGRSALAAGAVALAAGLASPVIEMVRLHPYQYTYFNQVAGGVTGARPRYMLDYWGLSLTQASRELRALIAAWHETAPDGRWNVAVCGPHPPVQVALGPQYSLTWNPKGADFAMMLGEFYCAKLDAPILFEIVREGVAYARVYDIRGRSVSNLLRVPGIDN